MYSKKYIVIYHASIIITLLSSTVVCAQSNLDLHMSICVYIIVSFDTKRDVLYRPYNISDCLWKIFII